MARRKTVNAEQLIEITNQMLKMSTCSQDIRKGWCAALEWVLHETGNYRGYRYLSVDELPVDARPGIRMGMSGDMLPFEQRFLDCDDTRRQYS